MRRIFSSLLIALAIIISAVSAAPAAHAGPLPEGNACPQGSYWMFDRDQCEYGDGSSATLVTEDEAVSQETAATAARIAKDKAAAQPLDSNLGKSPGEGFSKVMTWIMALFAWLVGVAAMTLNYAVYFTVVTMGDYVHKLSAVGVTWRILRDIGNIMLIFGFLIAGIMTILNAAWYGFSSKMIPMLLVAAVFLNFSLFISEAIIDTGNLFATQFYTQINGGNLPTPGDMANMTPASEGISNKIMAQLGLATIYNPATNTNVFEAGNTWIVGFMGIILFLITAFVMFSLAFILIARFVILLFLIIVAPVGFAGLAIPKLSGLASKWWSALAEQTITAPVLLLMLYIALAVITDVNFLTGLCGEGTCSKHWTGFVTGNDYGGFASMMLSFLVAMGLLLTVVILSKKMSAFGGSLATQTAGKLSFGVTAWAGRNSGGWLANKTAQGLRKTWVARVPLAGTGLVKGLDKIGAASFDVRGSKAFGAIPFGGVDAGKAQKGGYKADLKERTESRVKYAKDLKGRELTGDEKMRQRAIQAEIKVEEKSVTKAARTWTQNEQKLADLKKEEQSLSEEEYKARERVITTAITDSKVALEKEQEKLKEIQGRLEEVESVTDKGAQRKYASNLELGYLGLDDKSFFNKYMNFAANTEAIKKIRQEAKKSADDKTLDALKKVVQDSEGGAAATPASTPPAGGTTPGAGAPPAA